MELKPGYKLTEVGVIPEDWEVGTLESLAEKIMVGIASAATHAYRTKGVTMFRNQNIKSGFLDDADLLFIDPEYEKLFKNKRLRSGDLLTARTGYPGTTCVVPSHYESAQSFTTLITRPLTTKIVSSFLCHYINSEEGQKFFEQGQIGGAQKNVNAGTLRKMPVPIPPPPEQRAIAEALSDVDALLAALDGLIAKQRDLKQATMQQLLTGQTRLPGFTGEWEVKTFREEFDISAGGDFNPKLSANEQDEVYCYPIYSNALANRGLYGFCTYADHPANSITITARGTLGVATYRDHKYTAIGRVLVLTPKRQAAGQFFAEFINSRVKFAVESTGVPQLTAPQINSYHLVVPPLDEQTAIAAVLTDMDAELAALEQRRDKTRLLKQAMMQELLTGRTRLAG